MIILVTGSEGLIGRRLCNLLTATGVEVRHFDIVRSQAEDVRNEDSLASAVRGVDGIVHLAAVSRVVWGERDPDLCVATNVDAFRSLLRLCFDRPRHPWLIFVSSREVYGNADRLPVNEDVPLRPLNVYARTKQEGERLAAEARSAGLCVNTCRLSNVYGSTRDHSDRVIPAFASVAARGGRMRVEGQDNLFDFTNIADVGQALETLVGATSRGQLLPTVHFASGVGTTLGELAKLAKRHARAPVEINEAPKRDYDVSGFVGDPERAHQLLGWRTTISVETGVRDLIERLSRARAAAPTPVCEA